MVRLLFCILIAYFTLGFANSPTILYSKNSPFGRIEVVATDTPGVLAVCQNQQYDVYMSRFMQGAPTFLGMDYEILVTTSYCFVKELKKVLLLGLGIGEFPCYLFSYFPKAHLDVVEINPVMLEIMKKFRGPACFGTANYIFQDAFKYVDNLKSGYDLIFCDLYFEKPSVKKHYKGFFKKLRAKLTETGVFVFNACISLTSREIIVELLSSFDNITAQVDNYGSNIVFICYQGVPRTAEALQSVATKMQDQHKFKYSLVDLLRNTIFIASGDHQRWVNKFSIM